MNRTSTRLTDGRELTPPTSRMPERTRADGARTGRNLVADGTLLGTAQLLHVT